MDNKNATSYKQPTKTLARSNALTHAVKLLTTRRQKSTIAPRAYVRTARNLCSALDYGEYQLAADRCLDRDVTAWEDFRASVVGRLKARDLTIAYLAGPEPMNDIKTLIDLGVSAENIWAFEISDNEFERALKEVRDSNIRGVKLIKMKMEEYFAATPRRFDIIYYDACATFPSSDQRTLQTVSSIFRNSSLNPLGVLITNFSAPDTNKESDLHKYSHLIASYLYPKRTLDTTSGKRFYAGSSAEEHGMWVSETTMHDLDEDDSSTVDHEDDSSIIEGEEPGYEFLFDKVKSNFDFYYGSYITRQIMDIGSIIAPTERLINSKLWDNMFLKKEEIIASAKKNLLGNECGYVHEGGNFSLLRTIDFLDIYEGQDVPYSDSERNFFRRWMQQLVYTSGNEKKAIETILAFYACKEDKGLWRAGMLDVRDFNYRLEMPQLCDVPTEGLGFYPLFAQFSYPKHLNIKEAKRFTYVADGKKNRMFLDVLPFDECRYIYDWLSSGHLVASDLEVMSTQLTFRLALDALVKNNHNYQDDYLYGGHALPISSIEESSLKKRIDLNETLTS
ncbi:class I SAM-dependent methyltransferase [Pseudomonas sp. B21-032]|uniref:class I SAM-dependent methyltransferase n=1 Tax=Pseudomonas sp. B21-032 TaxID=2895483 RepID=UPI00215FED14|nr:class I SAM-dependent methyltransferase [Pseudomonas sp. B21-032]UVL59395.1 class I SAM-dependent methyltransferase [Pseudomonas sp. B21-032]